MQSVAETAAKDRDIAEFYRANGYKAIWTGKDRKSKQRREAFLRAVSVVTHRIYYSNNLVAIGVLLHYRQKLLLNIREMVALD